MLHLPNLSYLRRQSAVFSIGSSQDSTHAIYLKNKADLLKFEERYIVVMLDEIHCNPKQVYKGGSLVGTAINKPNEEATTVQTFMLCSLLSHNKDVAGMIPVKSLTAKYLKECKIKIINTLENAGNFVICLISDNNRINRNMFTELCQGELKPSRVHPNNSSRKLFFLFDTVHLLKCIRNN